MSYLEDFGINHNHINDGDPEPKIKTKITPHDIDIFVPFDPAPTSSDTVRGCGQRQQCDNDCNRPNDGIHSTK